MHFSPLAQGAALVLAATVLVGGLGHEEEDGRLVNMMRMRRTIVMMMFVGGALPHQINQNLAYERNLRIDGEQGGIKCANRRTGFIDSEGSHR